MIKPLKQRSFAIMEYIKQKCFTDIRIKVGHRRFRIKSGSPAWWIAAFFMCLCTGVFMLSLPAALFIMLA